MLNFVEAVFSLVKIYIVLRSAFVIIRFFKGKYNKRIIKGIRNISKSSFLKVRSYYRNRREYQLKFKI